MYKHIFQIMPSIYKDNQSTGHFFLAALCGALQLQVWNEMCRDQKALCSDWATGRGGSELEQNQCLAERISWTSAANR